MSNDFDDGRPSAQPGTSPEPRRLTPTPETSKIDHELFKLADLNGDGVLSRAEQLAFRRRLAGAEEHEHLPNDPQPHGLDPGPLAWHEFLAGDLPPARHQRWRKVAGRTMSKAWGDSLFGLSSQAAFWCALSTAPMLLALLGLVGLIAPIFGPDTVDVIHLQVDRLLHGVFNKEVADNLVGDTVKTIFDRGRTDVVSVGLVISLWAGSSAMSAFVEAITVAYRQHEFRHPVVERFFALALYLIALVFGILLLPLLAIGPEYLVRLFPLRWRDSISTVISISYYPAIVILLLLLLTTLYKVAPKIRHPWKRGIPGAILAAAVFLVASFGLRLYLSYVYSHGLTYGALATPITFLLFYYFASMAIILGAQFNNALLEYFPLKSRRSYPTADQKVPEPGPATG
jgi:membrane protein